jgi:hypothetical protein
MKNETETTEDLKKLARECEELNINGEDKATEEPKKTRKRKGRFGFDYDVVVSRFENKNYEWNNDKNSKEVTILLQNEEEIKLNRSTLEKIKSSSFTELFKDTNQVYLDVHPKTLKQIFFYICNDDFEDIYDINVKVFNKMIEKFSIDIPMLFEFKVFVGDTWISGNPVFFIDKESAFNHVIGLDEEILKERNYSSEIFFQNYHDMIDTSKLVSLENSITSDKTTYRIVMEENDTFILYVEDLTEEGALTIVTLKKDGFHVKIGKVNPNK